MPGTLLGAGDVAVNEINVASGFMEMAPRDFAIDSNVSALLAFGQENKSERDLFHKCRRRGNGGGSERNRNEAGCGCRRRLFV